MKTYEFPYGGSGGKGDSWDAIVSIDLTDQDYARVMESAKKGFWTLDEDPTINDIWDMIYKKIIKDHMKILKNDIEEIRSYLGLPKRTSKHNVVSEFLGHISICYPEDQE